jgi:hypothetical protein
MDASDICPFPHALKAGGDLHHLHRVNCFMPELCTQSPGIGTVHACSCSVLIRQVYYSQENLVGEESLRCPCRGPSQEGDAIAETPHAYTGLVACESGL